MASFFSRIWMAKVSPVFRKLDFFFAKFGFFLYFSSARINAEKISQLKGFIKKTNLSSLTKVFNICIKKSHSKSNRQFADFKRAETLSLYTLLDCCLRDPNVFRLFGFACCPFWALEPCGLLDQVKITDWLWIRLLMFFNAKRMTDFGFLFGMSLSISSFFVNFPCSSGKIGLSPDPRRWRDEFITLFYSHAILI